MDGTSTFSSSTRRHFLHGTAAGGVVVGVGGFSAVSQWFFRGREDGGAGGLGVFQPSQAAEVDEAAHVINRLTFGPAPGQHAMVTAMGGLGMTLSWGLAMRTIQSWNM